MDKEAIDGKRVSGSQGSVLSFCRRLYSQLRSSGGILPALFFSLCCPCQSCRHDVVKIFSMKERVKLWQERPPPFFLMPVF